MSLIKSLVDHPGYTLMRGPARFRAVRNLVAAARSVATRSATQALAESLELRLNASEFATTDARSFGASLKQDGCAMGIHLSNASLRAIRDYADTHPAYAFREPRYGFMPGHEQSAQQHLNEPMLLSQYFNVQQECAAVDALANDPWINLVALEYLGSVPHFIGVNLWWTYPVEATRQSQLKHAHVYHRDIDDFRFLKFFFYITDVAAGDGGHWIVKGSHLKAPLMETRDYFVTRRFEDDEVAAFYDDEQIIEVWGKAGTGFAEDTLCVHKGSTPVSTPRLVLQLQFGLFGLVPENDIKPVTALQMLPGQTST